MTFTPSFFLPLIEATNPPRSNPPPTIAGNALTSLPPFTTGLVGFTGFGLVGLGLTTGLVLVGLTGLGFGFGLGLGFGFGLGLGFILGFVPAPFPFTGLVIGLGFGLGLGFTLPVIFFLFAGFTNLGFALVCGFLGKTDLLSS